MGKKQEPFVPIETLLCFGLGLVGHPNASGKVNIRESDPTTIKLAMLANRSPGSLALKLANLDGRRANGAKHEQLLWNALTASSDLNDYLHLYSVIIRAARAVGLDEARLPDFLGWESNSMETVLGADRVSSSALRESIEEKLRGWIDGHPGEDPIETERAMIGSARVGQKQFARRVLENGGFGCVFCGLGLRQNEMPPSRMLIASHIKAWRHSESAERLDVANGLAACPTHDAGFDGHLFTISPTMEVVLGTALASAAVADPIVNRNFGPGGLSPVLLLSESAIRPGASYMEWHRSRTS
ncbi:putative restriction endonuclease [Salinibacterium sp. CAN_S4]|uniref:HNH endonuclease signature motif containing protein n=1 Tax=Salinibacterium sp. CAN_S4 TaxID=2787727 RepID=UPI0018EF82FA